MALKFEELQATVVDIVKGIALFAGMTVDQLNAKVLADDGTTNAKQEDALNGDGWVIIVSPPLSLETISQSSASAHSPEDGGTAIINRLTVVSFRTNPKKNKGAEAKNIFIGVRQIEKAALSWKPGPGEKGFTLPAQSPDGPDFEDIGCLTYDVRILKSVAV